MLRADAFAMISAGDLAAALRPLLEMPSLTMDVQHGDHQD